MVILDIIIVGGGGALAGLGLAHLLFGLLPPDRRPRHWPGFRVASLMVIGGVGISLGELLTDPVLRVLASVAGMGGILAASLVMMATYKKPGAAAILAVIDQEVTAASAADVEAYEAILAEDAVFMPPNGPSRSGTELRAWLRQFLEGFAVEWLSFEHGDVVVDGRYGYHSYEYEWRVTPRAGAAATVSRGKGLHVVRREEDGSWRILREIWNASPARDT